METLSTLGVDVKSIIIQGVGFLILLFVLKKFLFGKISALIKERSEGIKNAYTKIETDREEAEKLKIEYQVRLSEAEAEAAKRIQEAINEGDRMRTDIIRHAQEEAELMRIKAREGVEMERKKVMADLKNQVVSLSLLASSRLIKQSISQETAKKLVDDVVEEMGELSVR
ncbi:MAG: F0F1 ATP synthase subunit B [Candidatus Brocadiaceae bacterium]|nr:F0F1 ATP synthase subunit B [Candidatus Brocadiaceae bacterium]